MKVKRTVINVLIVVMVLIAVIFSYISFQGVREEYTVKNSYESIADEVRNIKQNKTDEESVDFAKLKKINPDIIAWIEIPDTPVDYPVVMAKDNNDYYLTHNVKGEYSQYGSIFTDFRLYGAPMQQKNCIIYGHNMGRWTDVMFSSLMEYRNQEYYDKHKIINIYTEKGKTEYKIISIMEVSNSSYAYNLTFELEKEYREWVKKCVSDSMVECNTEYLSNINRVATLSTCTYGSSKLVLICAPKK